MTRFFPTRVLGTPEEEVARAARLASTNDALLLVELEGAQGKAHQILEIVTEAVEKHPELKPLIVRYHTYLQLVQLIESLRGFTMGTRKYFANASPKHATASPEKKEGGHMPRFTLKCWHDSVTVLDHEDAPDEATALRLCREKGYFPLEFVGTPKEEYARAVRLSQFVARLREILGIPAETR